MLITFMQDLKEVTQDFHYEKYRAQRLATPPDSGTLERKKISNRSENAQSDVRPVDRDEELKKKDEELKRMQAMIENMKLQMQNSNQAGQ